MFREQFSMQTHFAKQRLTGYKMVKLSRVAQAMFWRGRTKCCELSESFVKIVRLENLVVYDSTIRIVGDVTASPRTNTCTPTCPINCYGEIDYSYT